MDKRRAIAQTVVIGLIASAIGIAIGIAIDWFPTQASTQAKKIDSLYDVLIVVSVPIFVGVTAVVLFSVWQFRMKPGQELEDGPPIHGNTKIEIVWTAVPAIMLVALCTYAYAVLHDIEKKPSREMIVDVTGQQFAWTFQYPAVGGKRVTTNQLYLPEGTSVKFNVRSVDVIHDFWVPEFRLKVDAVPGIVTTYRVTPSRNGSYEVEWPRPHSSAHTTS